jgi:hypothetical protein
MRRVSMPLMRSRNFRAMRRSWPGETNLCSDQATEINAWTIVVRPEPPEVDSTNGGGDSDIVPSEGLASDGES